MCWRSQLAPIANRVGLFEAPCHRVVQAFCKWMTGIGRTCTQERLHGPVEEALLEVLPLTVPGICRHVFVPTDSSWTAYFNNSLAGTDASGPVRVLCERMLCETMLVTEIPHTLRRTKGVVRGDYGSVHWTVYDPRDIRPSSTGGLWGEVDKAWDTGTRLAPRRVIQAANDGGPWVFVNVGEPFDFEDVEAYNAKRKRDRFTREMLERYLAEMGLRPLDKDFYFPHASEQGYLVHTEGETVGEILELSLEEARNYYSS